MYLHNLKVRRLTTLSPAIGNCDFSEKLQFFAVLSCSQPLVAQACLHSRNSPVWGMNMGHIGIAELIFFVTLVATFGASLLARRHSVRKADDALAGRNFNRWLVGLSAGTTANSGFIVTAAVGLGYTYGMQWMLLPLSWLLGDLIFWHFFPARINAFGHETRATTLSEMLKSGLSGPLASAVSILSALIIIVCLAGYTAAQWLAGQKFLSGAFGMPDYGALGLFALLIIAYSSIGGFRGSIYTDTLQAFIRITGTLIALLAVGWFVAEDPTSFSLNVAAAGPDFLNPFPGGTLVTVVGFVAGFAAAAIGFGLGQPQIVSRYLAGSSPEKRGLHDGYISVSCRALGSP